MQKRIAAQLGRALAVILLGYAGVESSFPAVAQVVAGDTFSDGKDGAKVHAASGFVCPAKIGLFERDAVGESDPATGADFCAYSALDSVYGTIKLAPITTGYDPKVSMAPDFAEQEGTGGKQISQGEANFGKPLAIFTRTYETAKLEDLHYRVLFAGAQVKNWAVEATIEYAEPRDTPVADDFLHAVYESAPADIRTK